MINTSILNDNITRGHIYKLLVPRTNKQLRRNLFPIWYIAIWNKLSVDTVLSEIVLTFKSRLDNGYTNDFAFQKFINKNRYLLSKAGLEKN